MILELVCEVLVKRVEAVIWRTDLNCTRSGMSSGNSLDTQQVVSLNIGHDIEYHY
jgi:hypothetical protein